MVDLTKKIVYLHIEKSAGTSFRAFVRNKAVKEENVFWWNRKTVNTPLNSPEIGDCYIIGGHRRINFYRDLNALYLAVVRNPLERAISLFHYHSTKDVMTAPGFQAHCFSDTLKNCEVFRNRLAAGQCRYISGKPSFDAAHKSMIKHPFIVGSFEYLSLFLDSFFGFMRMSSRDFTYANVGGDGYTERYSLDEDTLDILSNLLQEDYKLHDYICREHNGIFTNKLEDVDWDYLQKGFRA